MRAEETAGKAKERPAPGMRTRHAVALRGREARRRGLAPEGKERRWKTLVQADCSRRRPGSECGEVAEAGDMGVGDSVMEGASDSDGSVAERIITGR